MSAGFKVGWHNPKWDAGIAKAEAAHAARKRGGDEKARRSRPEPEAPDYESAIPF